MDRKLQEMEYQNRVLVVKLKILGKLIMDGGVWSNHLMETLEAVNRIDDDIGTRLSKLK